MSSYRPDTRRLFAAQGLRAFAYGFAAVLLGTSLEERDVPAWQVGVVLGATVAGTALMSMLVARYADRVGRRRWYAGMYVLLGVVGVVFAFAGSVWLLALAALTGVLSTEVIESGPFTSLEQPMLASDLRDRAHVHGFGVYNAIAAAAGSLGALAAAVPDLVDTSVSSRWFLVLVPVAVIGWALARRLSGDVEPSAPTSSHGRLSRSRASISLTVTAELAVEHVEQHVSGGRQVLRLGEPGHGEQGTTFGSTALRSAYIEVCVGPRHRRVRSPLRIDGVVLESIPGPGVENQRSTST